MTSLRVAGLEVACYGWDPDPPPFTVNRPALHPVRTLEGAPVTGANPADHPWHRGLGIALPDVDGVNLWGGPSYLPKQGYRDAGRGEVRRRAVARLPAGGVEDSLDWCDESGMPLLRETRRVAARGHSGGWQLAWTSDLATTEQRRVCLHSPGSRGRKGAGYGGFFWRLPLLDAQDVRVFTPDASGERDVNGARAAWLAIVVRTGWTAIVLPTDARTAADPWFVRVHDYAGIGSALAWNTPVAIRPDVPLRIGIRVIFLDRLCAPSEVRDLVGR